MASADQDELSAKKRMYLDFLDDEGRTGAYQQRIRKMIERDETRLTVSLDDLREMLKKPFEEITAMQMALKETVETVNSAYSRTHGGNFFVGFDGSFGANHVTPRGLSARLLGQMVCIEGIVSKCSLIHPKVVKSVHYCPVTEQSTERTYRDATSIDGMPTYGVYPKEDEQGNPLVTEFGLSTYKNHQTMTIQEMPERAPTGQLPRSVDVVIDDDLVDSCKPGDRVQMMGVYRALPSKRGGSTSGVFKTVLLVNNVKILGKEALMPPLTDVDIININKIARNHSRQNVFKLLANSLAPSIYGHEQIKQGLLALLLGGEEKNLRRGGHIRGDVNVLMVGDPSCGKSQLLRFVQNTAPHCITTTGRGASGVGLTAAVTTDQDTGEKRLEAGAMVLADRGVVCIDEFDKMSDLDRVAIHEVMEQQTVTISKAGIHTSLNARCSVLAAANPVFGQYNPYHTPMENIGLPDSLLSRFDLLFIVLDKMDPEIDRNLADHVLRSHIYRKPGEADGEAMRIQSSADIIISETGDNQKDEATPIYAPSSNRLRNHQLLHTDFVKKYILYAKARFHPVLTTEAGNHIAQFYSTLRSKEADKTLPVTARTLETLIRLATAHAKARLSRQVEEQDAMAALDLIRFAYFNESGTARREATPEASSDEEGGSDGGDSDGDDGDDAGKKKKKGGKGRKKDADHSPRRRSRRGHDDEDEDEDEDEEEEEEDRAGSATRGGKKAAAKTPTRSKRRSTRREDEDEEEEDEEDEGGQTQQSKASVFDFDGDENASPRRSRKGRSATASKRAATPPSSADREKKRSRRSPRSAGDAQDEAAAGAAGAAAMMEDAPSSPLASAGAKDMDEGSNNVDEFDGEPSVDLPAIRMRSFKSVVSKLVSERKVVADTGIRKTELMEMINEAVQGEKFSRAEFATALDEMESDNAVFTAGNEVFFV